MQKFEQTQKFQHNYYSAKLTKGKIWYVSYYVRNPYTQELERFRIKVNRIKNLKDCNIYCKKLIININNKLHSGWNPYVEENAVKMFTYLTYAIETFKKTRYKEIGKNSIRSYDNFINRFLNWLDKNHPALYTGSFDKRKAYAYMQYVLNLPDVGIASYNNALVFFRLLFNWLKNMDLVKENYFNDIDKRTSYINN